MTKCEFLLTDLDEPHLDGAVRLSRQADWPHRREDWDLVRVVGQGTVALAAGEVVATACVTPFGPTAFASMIIVRRDWRGRGLGRAVTERAMGAITAPTWRLIATQEGLPVYRGLGFTEIGRVLQHQGLARPGPEPAGVRWAATVELSAIAAMDAMATSMNRAPLLDKIAVRGRFAVTHNGYAAVRPFGLGEVVGPIVAQDIAAARRLLGFLLAHRAGCFVRVDTAEESGLSSWPSEHGLRQVGDGIAMRRGPAPPSATGFRVFALAAQAFG
jgi:GNAT superfamily N-acetyltransferase